MSVDGQEDNERPGKRQKVETKKPAETVKENGAGKRTRGKGRTSRYSGRKSRVERARFDADV